MVHTAESINNLNATQLRELTLSLISQIQQKESKESPVDFNTKSTGCRSLLNWDISTDKIQFHINSQFYSAW
jgi:hypothetical protein